MDLKELIREFIQAHQQVTSNRTTENQLLKQIVDVVKEAYPYKHVDVTDSYITIGKFTKVTQDDINTLLNLGIKNYYIDTHVEIVTHYLRVPSYYNNLTIYIDIDELESILED